MDSKETSRREFLKFLGLGAGATVLSISSFPGLLEQVLKNYNKKTADLNLENIEVRNEDPENPENHQFWLREDLKGED